MVVLTRTEHHLPFLRLRLADAVADVRLADLALTEDEVAAMVAAQGVHLEVDEAADLTRCTRGWVAGVRFAGMRMGGAAHSRTCFDGADDLSEVVTEFLRSSLARPPDPSHPRGDARHVCP